MAMTGVDLLFNKQIMSQVKEEFNQGVEKEEYPV